MEDAHVVDPLERESRAAGGEQLLVCRVPRRDQDVRRARAAAEAPGGRDGVAGLAADDAGRDPPVDELHALLRCALAVEARGQALRVGAVVHEGDPLVEHLLAEPVGEGALAGVEADLAERGGEHDHGLRAERGPVAARLERALGQRRQPVRDLGEVGQLRGVAMDGARVGRVLPLGRDELDERPCPPLRAVEPGRVADGVVDDRVRDRAAELGAARQRRQRRAEALDAVLRRRRLGRGKGRLRLARLAGGRVEGAGRLRLEPRAQPPQRLRVGRAGGAPGPAAAGAQRQLLLGVLVGDPRAAEAQQLLPLAQQLDVFGAERLEQLRDQTPTCTSRKRPGTVPCPMWATWSGSPLLHDGMP